MLNNLSGESGKKSKVIETCVKEIETEIGCLRDSISKNAEDIEENKEAINSLSTKVSASCITSDYATTDSLNVLSSSSIQQATVQDASIKKASIEDLTVANPVETIDIKEACIAKITGLTDIGSVNANALTADGVTADNIISNNTMTAQCLNATDAAIQTLASTDISATDIETSSISADTASIGQISGDLSVECTVSSTNLSVSCDANIDTVVASDAKITDLSTSNQTAKDCVALSKFIALSNFNGEYNVEVDGLLDINVVGNDGMYTINFSNKDPETMINISATDQNKGLVIELNDCMIGCQACYSYKSIETPDIRYEANYDYYRCDKSVPTCNNLWSKHIVVVGRRALDNGLEIAGCLHAECIKLDNPIVDNILVTDSLTSYRNNCLGDAYVFPLEIAECCCSYGKIQVADANPHETVCTEDGRCYCLDNSTEKTIIDTDAVCFLDVTAGAVTEEDADVSGCAQSVCTNVTCLSKDGLSIKDKTCLNDEYLCVNNATLLNCDKLVIDNKVSLDTTYGLCLNGVTCLDQTHLQVASTQTDKISDYDSECTLASYDNDNKRWTVENACGLVDCACKDENGCTIKTEYVHCVDMPLDCAKIVTGSNGEKCLCSSYICKDSESYDITTGLVCDVNITEEDQVQCLNVKCVNSDTCQYVIDSRAVLECTELPAEPLNKVYNIDERNVYSKDVKLATACNLDECVNSLCCIHNEDCSTCVATLDSSVAVKGNTSVAGDLTINGNIYQCGDSYITHAEDLNVNDATITVRANAESAMVAGDYAGITVCKYDGTNDMSILVDNEGTARLGKSTSLQPFALRNEEACMTDGALVCWNAADKRLDTACSVDCYVCNLICDVAKCDDSTVYTRVNGETVCIEEADVTKYNPYCTGTNECATEGYLYNKSDGVTEVGKYLDFHDTGSTSNYDGRLMINDSGCLQWNGKQMLTVNCIQNGVIIFNGI